MPDAITAITFVALGTSLPDTFASRSAALADATADAAVGNVTGSNAVNVFLGLGLPWMIGALYWSRKGATPEWAARYPDQAALYPQGGFVVPAGDLGYSVTVFCVCAVLCLGTLTLRRSVLGGELGGPSWAAARDRSQGGGVAQALLQKRVVAAFFFFLWGVYIVASIVKSSSHAAA